MHNQFSQTVRSFLSPIVQYIDDPDTTEIMINRYDEIWIERHGKTELTDARFHSEDELMSAVNNISQFVQRRINDEIPHMDARLPDGSRIHVILPPCARKGICIAIRKFSKDPLTIDKLIDYKSINDSAVAFLTACIYTKKNLMVSGGTGSGKTSLLNAVSSLIPNNERIIVIEDSAELQLQQDHILLLETKVPDQKGLGEVTIRDLLKSTLRLRPDRIIIGEIRGGESLDFLQAMNTGHGGSMGTIHANSPLDALSRLETLSLFSGVELPLKAIRSQVASAVNIIVQTSRFYDGSRKISHISEVFPLADNGDYQVKDIFIFKQQGVDKDNNIIGHLVPTGNIPSFIDQIQLSGIEIDRKIFSSP